MSIPDYIDGKNCFLVILKKILQIFLVFLFFNIYLVKRGIFSRLQSYGPYFHDNLIFYILLPSSNIPVAFEIRDRYFLGTIESFYIAFFL